MPDRGVGVADGVVETFRDRNGLVFTDWPKPQAVLVFTGELDGYIEPCGCTGKENQKGGLSRRRNFLAALEAVGWPTVAVDLGGQVRRFGRQSEAKFQSIADGLRIMGYAAVGLGAGDLRLPAEELVAAVAAVGDAPTPFVTANVGLFGIDAGITPRFRVVEAGGLRIGITSVLGDKAAAQLRNDNVDVLPAAQALADVAAKLAGERCAHQILLCAATPEETAALAATTAARCSVSWAELTTLSLSRFPTVVRSSSSAVMPYRQRASPAEHRSRSNFAVFCYRADPRRFRRSPKRC